MIISLLAAIRVSQQRVQCSSLCNRNRLFIMATYEEVKAVLNDPKIYLIDVRNKEELDSTGVLPSSINIPLPELCEVLKGSEEKFNESYGREFPAKDSEIIFSCRSGRRANEAAVIAKEAGFTNVKVYSGSWLDWAQNEGLKTE